MCLFHFHSHGAVSFSPEENHIERVTQVLGTQKRRLVGWSGVRLGGRSVGGVVSGRRSVGWSVGRSVGREGGRQLLRIYKTTCMRYTHVSLPRGCMECCEGAAANRNRTRSKSNSVFSVGGCEDGMCFPLVHVMNFSSKPKEDQEVRGWRWWW